MERFFYNFQPASLPPDGVDQYGFPDYEDDGFSHDSLMRSIPQENQARSFTDRVRAPTANQPELPRLPAKLPAMRNQTQHKKLVPISAIPPRFRALFPYESFNEVQSACFNCLVTSDVSCVIASPTASGKTVCFELAIVRLLTKTNGVQTQPSRKKVVYVAPIKALCHERAMDWTAKFTPLGLKCLELTGDSEDHTQYELTNADIILTTPEKWDSLTRKWKELRASISQIELVLIDEVHLLHEDRGPTLEAVVSRMKTLSTDVSMMGLPIESVRFVALSATIPNLSDVGDWLGSPLEAQFKFGNEVRPVPIDIHVIGYPPSKNDFLFDNSLCYKLPDVLEMYSSGRPAIVFCTSRKAAVTCAEKLKASRHKLAQAKLAELQRYLPRIPTQSLKECLVLGIAYHHAGLSLDERRLVEELFRQDYIQVLCSTSTLAQGVNLPAHLVVIKSTSFWAKDGFKQYDVSSLHQMIGRAGRPQYDDSAVAVIMTEEKHKGKLELQLTGQQTIESKLHTSLIEHLNAEVSLGTITDVSLALTWIKSTYLFCRISKNPMFYGLPKNANRSLVEKRLKELCVQDLERLRAAELITMDDSTLAVMNTPLGVAMAKYYIRFGTMEAFNTVGPSASVHDIIEMLSTSQEFKGTVLRRGERKPLTDLNSTNKYPWAGKLSTNMDKIFCLIQAALQGTALQDFSMKQEMTKIMMDLPRITRCFVEYCVHKKYGPALKNAHMLFVSPDFTICQTDILFMLTHGRPRQRQGPVHAENIKKKFQSMLELKYADRYSIEAAVGAKLASGVMAEVKQIPDIQLHVKSETNEVYGGATLTITVATSRDTRQTAKPQNIQWVDGLILMVSNGDALIFHQRLRVDTSSSYKVDVRYQESNGPEARVTLMSDYWRAWLYRARVDALLTLVSVGVDQFVVVNVWDSNTTGDADVPMEEENILVDEAPSPLPKKPAPSVPKKRKTPSNGTSFSVAATPANQGPVRRCKHRCRPHQCRHVCCMLHDQSSPSEPAPMAAELPRDEELPNFSLLDDDDVFETPPPPRKQRPVDAQAATNSRAPSAVQPNKFPLSTPKTAPQRPIGANVVPATPGGAKAVARTPSASISPAIITKPSPIVRDNKQHTIVDLSPSPPTQNIPKKSLFGYDNLLSSIPSGWDLDALYGPTEQ